MNPQRPSRLRLLNTADTSIETSSLTAMTAAPSFSRTATRRTRHAAVLLATAAAVLVSLPAATQSPPSPTVAPGTSMSDQSIRADQQNYIAQQANIKAVNDSGRHRVASYSLAKAQCWLDVSFHEWSRNDRSAFPQLALTESNKITRYLSGGGDVGSNANPANQTPLVNDAARLRPDLWERTQAIKGHSGYRCVERQIACAEVELVHAGNEFNQQGWRHAKPYVQIAEDLVAEAQAGAAACPPIPSPAPPPPPPPPPVVPVVPPPPVPAPPPPPQTTRAEAQVLFYFDRYEVGQMLPETRQRLDNLIAEVTSGRVVPTRILLSGHADISNSTGNKLYNVRLAERRVDTVRDYLTSRGIDWKLIATESRGDAVQVQTCDRRGSRKAYEDCLQPNRRVEVVLEGVVPRR